MKKFISLKIQLVLILLVSIFNSNIAKAQSTLCASSATTFCCEYVSSVSINGVVRNTSNTGFSSGPGFQDFSGTSVTSMVAGNTYPVSVTVQANSTYLEYVKVWFDFNGNGNLTDAGELVMDQNATFVGTHVYTGNVTIPPNAFNGQVYIRVIMVYSNVPQLCGSYVYGNTLDFKATISGGVTPRTLSVSRAGTNQGNVTSSPAGINTAIGANSANFTDGTTVTLTSTNAVGGTFVNWTGAVNSVSNPITVFMDANKSVTANYTAAIPANPTSVSASATTICNGSSTTLTANGAVGTVYWYSGSCGGTLVGTGNPISVSPSTNTTYFARNNNGQFSNGCASSTITVNTFSTAPTGITGNTTICNGDNTTLTLSGGSAGTGAVANWYTASCGGTLVGTGSSITVSPLANTTYYVRYEGACNTTTCVSTMVTVNTTPIITCPSNISANNNLGLCGANVTFPSAATATGSPTPTITYSSASGSFFPVGTTIVTATATNSCGSTSCSFTVTVLDTENPTITCPADITVCGSQAVTFATPTASDNCSAIVTQTAGLPSGSIFPIGTNVVTYTATDPANNSVSCSFNVIVNAFPSADAGSALTLDCTTPSGVIGSAMVIGNSYAWSPSGDLSATNISNPTVTPTTNTAYTTTYTVTVTGGNACIATSTVVVSVDKVLPVADAGLDQSINYGSSTIIGTPALVGNTYSWSPATALSSTTDAMPTANPTAPSTTYTVTVTNANGCTATSAMTISVLLPIPTIVSYPNNQYCFTDNTVLKSTGLVGATFNWTLPAGSTGVIDNSIPGESTVTIIGLDANSNGTYSVYQSLAGYPNSPIDNVTINGTTKPSINFVTTSCVSNNGQITVNASGSNLEYAVNGGSFQASNVLTSSAGSTFIVEVKEVGSSCVNYYTGQCVSCTAPGACATPPRDSIVTNSKTCVNTPISITGYFSNASNATWTTSGSGTFSSTSCNVSPCSITYTPSASDISNSHVVITLSTDDPDGAGPCEAAVTSKSIELYNGTVFPTITNNGPVCENSTLSIKATGSDGTITWTGPSAYSGNGDSITINNAPVTMSGIYTATSNIAGCTSSSASQNAVVVAIPTLTVSAVGNAELCAGGGNGNIDVNVSGGSGNYTICYTGNLGNCINGTSANFGWIAPGSYNVTVVDQICPNNVFTYPVTVLPGTPVPAPTIASDFSACAGESLTLSGSVTAPAVNILWVHGPTFLNAVGNPLVIQNASMSMSGNYYAKAIDINGCASSQVATIVTISEKPIITHVQVNCFGTTAKVTISATTSTGTLSYSLDGTSYQVSNEFNTVGQGNYTVHVKNGTTNCEATLPIYILNCACPDAPVVTITAPLASCGTTAIPVSTSFTNVGNATWSTTGTGSFSTTNGASPLASVYTPSAADLATGHVNLVVTTADPDGAGPCTPSFETISILLKDTLTQPSIITNQASYCQDDTLMLTSNTTNPIIWTGVGGFYADSSVGVVTGLTQFLSGYYKVTSTGNGCASKSDSVFITIAPAPVITITQNVVNENCEGHANGEVTITATGGSGSYNICNSLFLNCATTSSSNTFKWLAPSTYTFYVADASCASHQNTIIATVGAGLHVDAPTTATYNNPVCVGEDLVLTATGAIGSSYLWTDMTNNFTATGEVVTRTDAAVGMTGNYKVQRLESGCASIAYLLPVHIYDNPYIATVDTMCMGSVDSGRITINATIATGDSMEYALNDGAFQTSNVFDNLTNGLFQLKARAIGSDCETTMNAIELYCACYCGKDAQVNVFPNPNDGTFNLNVTLVPKDASIVVSVFDMSGRTIYEQALEESNGQMTTSIDIKAYASGPYMVRVLVDGERFLVPIMVNGK